MKYIKSDEYTYDEMWGDTEYILKQYGWELKDISVKLNHSTMVMYDPKNEVTAGYSVDHTKDEDGYGHAYTNCYLIKLGKNLDAEKLYGLQRQLFAIWNDIDEAMGIIE